MKKPKLKGALWAFLILGAGIILLLVNIGLISLEIKTIFVDYYPVLLLAYGLYLLYNHFFQERQNGFSGLFLIVFSVLLLLDRIGILTFTFGMFWKLWPLVLIYLGLQLLFKREPIILFQAGTKKKYDSSADKQKEEDALDTARHEIEREKENLLKVLEKKELLPSSAAEAIERAAARMDEAQLSIKNLNKNKKHLDINIDLTKSSEEDTGIATVEYTDQNWTLKPMKIHKSIGDYHFDFNKAYIPEKETRVELTGWIGDVDIAVPPDIPIRVEARVKVGNVDLFSSSSSHVFGPAVYFESPGYDDAVKKIDFIIKLSIGNVTIDKV